MNLWSKVFLGLTIVAMLGYSFYAARTLLAHRTWQGTAGKLSTQLEQAKKDHQSATAGAQPGEGLRDLKVAMRDALLWRQRMWRDCTPGPLNPQTGAVTVSMAQRAAGAPADPGVDPAAPAAAVAAPHGVPVGSLLHVIDQRPRTEGGGYVGAFRVASATDSSIDLVPDFVPLPEDGQRMQRMTGPWTLHEKMPVDSRDVFASLDETQRSAMLPPSSVPEYAKDGQPADPADPQDRVVDGKYRRRLRDYEVLYRDFDRERILRLDAINSAEADIQSLARSQQGADAQIAFNNTEIQQLQTDLARAERERAAVIAHREQLDKSLAETTQRISTLMAENRRLANLLHRREVEAVNAAGQVGAAN